MCHQYPRDTRQLPLSAPALQFCELSHLRMCQGAKQSSPHCISQANKVISSCSAFLVVFLLLELPVKRLSGGLRHVHYKSNTQWNVWYLPTVIEVIIDRTPCLSHHRHSATYSDQQSKQERTFVIRAVGTRTDTTSCPACTTAEQTFQSGLAPYEGL